MESVKLKTKETAHESCILINKLFLRRYGLVILILLYILTRMEQLSKWMVDGGSQVPHCWSKNLQISNDLRSIPHKMVYVIMN